MWRQKGKSLNYKQRIRALKNNQNSLRYNNRLHFPVKEQEDGYIGRKQFNHKFNDKVVLAPPTLQKIQRFNKLNVDDIDGATPNLNIQSIKNKLKHKKNTKSLKTLPTNQSIKPIDSLQTLMQQNPLRKNNESMQYLVKQKIKTQGNQEELMSRNLQLSRHNIFGVNYQIPQIYSKKINRYRQKTSIINPTYLSSWKIS